MEANTKGEQIFRKRKENYRSENIFNILKKSVT